MTPEERQFTLLALRASASGLRMGTGGCVGGLKESLETKQYFRSQTEYLKERAKKELGIELK